MRGYKITNGARYGSRFFLSLFLCQLSLPCFSGTYIFAGESWGVDLVAHPEGYNGTGGVVTVNVCQGAGDGNGPALADWEQSLRNIIAVYNRMQPTTGNLRLSVHNQEIDFESVALHEVGHCIGKGHVNAATESGLGGSNQNYTKATDGINNVFDINDGTDNVIGSGDDVRGDDINLHWFRKANNNPFTIDYDTVDSSSYARDTSELPGLDSFATNADRTVADNVLNASSTEAVMQQGSFFGEAQRGLAPDDVATLQFARAGDDRVEGGSDDYTVQLQYATSNCHVNLSFDDAETGFAVCKTSASVSFNNFARFVSADAYFNSAYNWELNSDKPCQQTITLRQNEWHMFSLPCQVGISTGETVADVLGDDLTGVFNSDWVVYRRDESSDSYVRLGLADPMESAEGYWVFSSQAVQSFDVEGQYAGSPDVRLSGEPGTGRWNLVGHPLDFPVNWSEVQIVDDASIIGIGSVNTTTQMEKEFHVWNGSTYDAFDDVTPGMQGTLQAGGAIWTKVYQDGLRLRIPAEPPNTLTPPTGLTATPGTFADKVVLVWADAGGGVQAYHIRRWDYDGSTCSTSGAIHAWVTADISTFEDTDFSQPSTTGQYCYDVRSCWGGEAYPRVNGCSGYGTLVLGYPTVTLALEEVQTDVLTPVREVVLQQDTAVFDAGRSEVLVGLEPQAAPMASKSFNRSRGNRNEEGWYVRIIAEAEGKQDRGAVFGKLPDSVDGPDVHDLEKRAPFGDRYLSVLFPHPEWGGDEWGFASDYRALEKRRRNEWTFAVYVSEDVDEVTLSFEGPAAVLRKSSLRHLNASGRPLARHGDRYTFAPQPGFNFFTVRVKGR